MNNIRYNATHTTVILGLLVTVFVHYWQSFVLVADFPGFSLPAILEKFMFTIGALFQVSVSVSVSVSTMSASKSKSKSKSKSAGASATASCMVLDRNGPSFHTQTYPHRSWTSA